jgi:hypothetical protein
VRADRGEDQADLMAHLIAETVVRLRSLPTAQLRLFALASAAAEVALDHYDDRVQRALRDIPDELGLAAPKKRTSG